MKSRFVNKMLSGILAVALSVTMFSGCNPVIADTVETNETVENKIDYNFKYKNAGLAYGEITVSTAEPGSYQLFWGDKSGNKLKYNGVEFTELADITTTESNLTATYKTPSEYTVIPEGAEKLLLLNKASETVTTYDIPSEKKFNEGNLSYKFGLMSDVHYNRYKDFSADDSVPAFDNALKFISNQGIDFLVLQEI